PVPEISYELATATRQDIIMATGRSDYPNQVNNVLGFPFIFRGALDVRSRAINEEMKLAAVYALAELAKAPVPEEVNLAYNITNIKFGKDYIIPKPSDPRLITHIAPAVAKAAIQTGVARKLITDWDAYNLELSQRLGLVNPFISKIKDRAQACPKRVVFADAENYKILKAAEIVMDEHLAIPILLGNEEKIKSMINEYEIAIDGVEIMDYKCDRLRDLRHEFADIYYQKRQRKGITLKMAHERIRQANYFGAMLVERGYADAMISGLTASYPETIRPALHVIGKRPGVNKVSGMYILNTKKGTFFMADATVNINPDVNDLVEITLQVACMVKEFKIKPRIAMLSFSNFGSTVGEIPSKVIAAVDILHRDYPELVVDGEIQANFALNKTMLEENFPFSSLVGEQVNTLIFPELTSANIAYKMLQELGAAEAIGPVLMGLNKSVHVLQMGCTVAEIVNMTTIAVLDSQCREEEQ
ncbi:MAG: phosphate acyltransferase, partial [Bacteroidota bacterium]|nr:phosphate acyltransferase [Bacteroidota bacterium]